MSHQAVFAQLRDALATLYSDPTTARRIADDSGLNSNNIAFSSRSVDNWHAILVEAANIGKLDSLVTVALYEYSGNLQLRSAWQAYRDEANSNLTNNIKTDTSKADNISKPQVFISYGKEDRSVALNLYHQLRDVGFRPWIDQEDILPGEEWDLKIKNTLKNIDFLIVCLSKNSIGRRGYIQREMKIAVDMAEEMPDGTIFLIPVRLEECIVPARLAKYQYVDLYSSNGLNRVIQAIKAQWERI